MTNDDEPVTPFITENAEAVNGIPEAPGTAAPALLTRETLPYETPAVSRAAKKKENDPTDDTKIDTVAP
jgi:hypothetical protein